MSISDELWAAAKRRVREQGVSLSEVIDSALRGELAASEHQVPDDGPEFNARR